ncbi:MAG: hypothetical protein GX897_09750 [Clostridiales bacterium]|nr:hypothetical protein [Clostridiales bacterium]
MKMSFDPLNGWGFDREKLLSSHDVVFKAPVPEPTFGLPIGNGDTGCLIWTENERLRMRFNKTDLWDRSPHEDREFCPMDCEEVTVCRGGADLTLEMGCPAFETIFQNEFEARLSLHDAVGMIYSDTPFCKTDISAFSSEQYDVTVIKSKISYSEPMPAELKLSRWGSRSFIYWYLSFKPGTEYGLSGTDSSVIGDVMVISQVLNGTCFAVAVLPVTDNKSEIKTTSSRAVNCSFEAADEIGATIYVSVKTADTEDEAIKQAVEAVNEAKKAGADAIYAAHAAAWADFWTKSFVSLPKEQDYLENLWYLNLYYANSQMKAKYPAHFCNGIWGFYYDFVPWIYFFHYNMQLATFPLEAAGHPELLETYYNFRISQLPQAQHFARKIKGTSGAFYTDVCDSLGRMDTGTDLNCTCGAQIALSLYNHYLYSGDESYLNEKALPIMKEVAAFYLDMLKIGDDGYYHIYGTQGYEGSPILDDSITDLVMIRALFGTLCEILPAEETAEYKKRLDKLVPYVTVDMLDEEVKDGRFTFGIGEGEKIKSNKVLSVGLQCDNGQYIRKTYGNPARDYYGFPDTEIAPVFPAGLIGIKDKGTKLYDLIYNSVCLHHTAEMEDGPVGKNSAGSVCMGWCMMPIYLARMGLGDFLKKYQAETISTWMIYPQGFGHYTPSDLQKAWYLRWEKYSAENLETGEKHEIPAWNFRHFDYETLPILSASVNEMLMQSYDGTVRLFCALPDNYKTAFNLKAVGGFDVQAIYDNGAFDVRIHSKLGNVLKIAFENTGYEPDFVDRKNIEKDDSGVYTLETKPDEWIHITSAGHIPEYEREYNKNKDVKRCGLASLGKGKEYGK